jgi:hypothetical protein
MVDGRPSSQVADRTSGGAYTGGVRAPIADGRWFVDDFVETIGDGDAIFLVEVTKGCRGVELAA